ncbi:GPR1 protein, partial [Atractosteus spatula]|nr:GPR1 protein [Atractosteus spatula]
MENYDYDNYSYEYYEEEPPQGSQKEVSHIFSVVIYSISFVLGAIGNGAVIWATGFKTKKTVNTIWLLLNLAVADFVFVLFLPFSIDYVVNDFHWNFGKALCKVNSFISVMNLFASVLFLTVISLDRYVALVHLSWSQRNRTPLNSVFVCVGVWITAAALSTPSLIFRDTLTIQKRVVCYNNFHDTDLHTAVLRHTIIVSVRTVVGFLIPFSTISVSGVMLVVKMRRSAAVKLTNFSKTVAAIIVAFFFCWAPYHIFSLMEITVHHNSRLHDVLRTGFPLATSLAFFNSCLNPILYVFTGKKVKAILHRSCMEVTKHVLRDISQAGSESVTLSDQNAKSGEENDG